MAANAELAQKLCEIGLTAVAFETVTDEQGRLPLLAPMSEIAGRLATQIGTHLLHQPQGGRGILLGGLSTTDKGHVVVLGAGHAGSAAALLAFTAFTKILLLSIESEDFPTVADTTFNVSGK